MRYIFYIEIAAVRVENIKLRPALKHNLRLHRGSFRQWGHISSLSKTGSDCTIFCDAQEQSFDVCDNAPTYRNVLICWHESARVMQRPPQPPKSYPQDPRNPDE